MYIIVPWLFAIVIEWLCSCCNLTLGLKWLTYFFVNVNMLISVYMHVQKLSPGFAFTLSLGQITTTQPICKCRMVLSIPLII